MATKKTTPNKINNDFDLDGNLDFDLFDFKDPMVKDDRKPIVRAATAAAKGAAGVARDSAFLKRTLKDVLPKGYGQTWDAVDRVTDSVRNLYDESAKEIKPALKETKRVLTKLVPRESKIVPQAIQKQLKKWAKEIQDEQRNQRPSQWQEREGSIQFEMEKFRLEQQQLAEQRAEADGRDRLRQGVEMTRHREVSNWLGRAAVSLDKIQKYQSSVTLGYQKKSLEVQMRSLFMLQDMLAFAKEDSLKRDALLVAISKNTTLPDAVKINSKEAREALARNKFNESLHRGLFGGRDDLVERTLSRISNSVLDRARGVAGMAQQGLFAASMAEGGSGLGLDKYQMGGDFAGQQLGQAGARYLGSRAKRSLASGRFDRFGGQRILRGGQRLEDFTENASQRLNAFRKTDKYMFDDSMRGGFMRFLQGLVPGMGIDTSLRVDNRRDLDAPASATKRTNISINNVIPGYLARILRELQVTRTGNKSIELVSYNYASQRFTSKGKDEATMFKEIINGKAAKRTNAQLDAMLKEIDPSGKALSSQARQELKRKLLSNSMNHDEASKENLAMYGSYKGVQENLVDEIVPVMRQFFSNLSADKKVEFSRASNSLAGSVADPREAIQLHADQGNLAYLKRMGFVERDGKNINMAKIIDYVLDPSNAEAVQAMTSNRPAGGAAFQSMARNLSPQQSLKERAQGAFTAAKTAAGQAFNNSQAIMADVYVSGEEAPRLLATKLQQGVYRDVVTKKVIRTIDQIRGPIEDVSDNMARVLETKDLLKLNYINPRTQTVERLRTAQEGVANFLVQNNVPTSLTDLTSLIKRKAVESGAFDEISDVYVEGEGTPRLQAVKIKAGQYKDILTGKIIRHQNDINGEVADENDKVVLSVDDMPKLQVWDSRNKRFGKIRKLGNIALMMAKGLWWVQTRVMVPWAKWNVKQLWNVTKAVGKVTQRVFGNPARDVFVQGESKPRLYAARMLAGDYRDAESGERIMHQDQITGAVIDREDRVVLEVDDLDKLQVYNNVLRVFNPFRLIKWAGKKIGQGLWWAAKGFQTKVAPAITKAALKTMKTVLHATARAIDVCVKGDPNPRLLAHLMKQGRYYLAESGKTIYNIRDITGAVMGPDGILITQDEYERGLTRLDGKPLFGFGNMVMRQLGNINRLFSMRVKLKPGAARDASTAAILKSKTASAADKQVALLEDIKAIFQKRFGSVFGDRDGDGVREGSWQDLLKKRQGQATTAQGAAGKGGNDDVKKMGLLSGLASMLFGKKKKGEEEEGGYGMRDALEDASNADDLLGGRRGRGRFGRLGRFARFGKFGRLAAGGALVAGGGYLADGAFGKLGVGKNALNDSQDDDNWDNMSAWEKAQSGLSRGIEKAGQFAFMGNLANQAAKNRIDSETQYMQNKAGGIEPGKGLLDYLAMATPFGMAYSIFKGADEKNTAYDNIRFVQYGFDEKNKDARDKAAALEDYLQGLVVDGTSVSLNDSKMDVRKVMSPWGFDYQKQKDVEVFFGWFKNRFKPVYLLHLNAVKRFTGKADLRNQGSIKKEDQASYIDAIRMAGGPYDYTALPSPSGSWKATSGYMVQLAVDKAIKDLGIKKDAKIDTAKTADVTAAAAAGLATDNSKPPTMFESFMNKIGLGDDKPKLPAVAMAGASSFGKDIFSQDKGVNALDAVRFKVYGLESMDSDRVLGLRSLESQMGKLIKYGGDGKATWGGDAMAILVKCQGMFGISDVASKEAISWLRWFKDRFLPAFLAFTTSYRNLTGKDDFANASSFLKPGQQLQVAQLLVGLSGIWSRNDSPWAGVNINTNASSADLNISFLKLAAADQKLQEQKAPEKTDSGKPQEQSLWQRAKSSISDMFSSNKAATNKLPEVTSPDAEAQVKATGAASPVAVTSGVSSSAPAMASGELSDGRNAMAHLNVGKGVVLDGMNPTFMRNFYGMAEEYGRLTGKKININDAFRSYQAQMEAKKKYGARAASPGSSLHEFGLAMDIDSATLDEMDKMGLMRKYGFTRPVGGEKWHMEPIGIQTDIAAMKKDSGLANKAIQAGLGKGGGGYGTLEGAAKYSRNRDYAMSIMQAGTGPSVDNAKGTDKNNPTGVPNATSPSQALQGNATAQQGLSATGPVGLGVDGGVSASADGETKPGMGAATNAANAPGSSPSGINPRGQSMPADPSVKVPDPKGGGYAGLKDTIEAAAKMVGVDPDTMVRMAAIESSFNPSAAAKTSSASGLFQFTKDTWRAMIDKYGRQYGYTSQTPTTDPKASAIMAAHMLKDAQKFVSSKIKRPFGPTEAYMTHFLGMGGAVQFLKALETNPGAIAAQVMPKAAQANVSIFYDNGRPRTLQEVYAVLDNKVNGKNLAAFGIPNAAKSNAALAANAGGDPTSQGAETSSVALTAPSGPQAPSGSGAQAANDPLANPANAAGTPLGDAYGFQPMQAAQQVSKNGQPPQLDPSLLGKTESILSEHLEVTKTIAERIAELVEVVRANGTGGGNSSSSSSSGGASRSDYAVPKPRVDMRRTTT